MKKLGPEEAFRRDARLVLRRMLRRAYDLVRDKDPDAAGALARQLSGRAATSVQTIEAAAKVCEAEDYVLADQARVAFIALNARPRAGRRSRTAAAKYQRAIAFRKRAGVGQN